MATTSYGPNAGGVTYTYNSTSHDVTITDGSTTLHALTGVFGSEIYTNTTTAGALTIGTVAGVGRAVAVIVPGATATVDVTSVLSNASVYVGGTGIINSALSALTGLNIHVDGGAASLANGVTAVGAATVTLDEGGSFTAAGGLATLLNGTTIAFGTGGGVFIANGQGALIDLSKTTITGFTAGVDKIEFQGMAGPVSKYTISAATGGVQTITLYNGATEIGVANVSGANLNGGAAITVNAGQTGPLTVSVSGNDITFDPVTSTLCFLAGTMIATPDGEAAVETLRQGDLVLTADGRAKPVRWIGINTVSTRFADPQRNMPVRISAGALGDGLPKRDLLLSPDHALLLNGVLVQAGALVNGATIRQEPAMPDTFRYYHVELAAHDLILAEGLTAETFVDNASRMNFDNWQEFLALCAGDPQTGELSYPRVKSYRQMPAALRQSAAAHQQPPHAA